MNQIYFPLTGIKTILFDLDGTLRYNRPSMVQAFLDYAVHLGAEDAPNRRLQAHRWTHYYWAQSPELLADLDVFQELNDAFWERYALRHLEAFGCEPEWALAQAPELHRYMKEDHQPEDWVPPEVPHTLQALKEAGYRLGVLSNRDRPCQDYLEAMGLSQYLDIALVAGEIAAWKPDPAIFTRTLERLGARAAETLYVGDNYYADILGAAQAGLPQVLVDPEGLFPEATCPVIHTLDELLGILLPNSKFPVLPEILS